MTTPSSLTSERNCWLSPTTSTGMPLLSSITVPRRAMTRSLSPALAVPATVSVAAAMAAASPRLPGIGSTLPYARMDRDYATILYDDSTAPVARITLNRPDKRNPIGPVTAGELVHAFIRAREEPAVRVVVLTGAGSVFSAGGDLSMM